MDQGMGASSTQRGFPYSPLEDTDIRVLRVKPGADEKVICYLHHATLDDSLYYDALSYVWGDASTRREITVNGLSFLVTENLYTALKRLRSIPPEGDCAFAFFWIDAICINQDDAVEKSRQVPQMNRIYTNAFRVFVWIPPTELRHNAELAAATQTVRDLFRVDKARWWEEQLAKKNQVTMSLEEFVAWQPIFHQVTLFEWHSWFSRIWTLQESVLANNSPIFLFEDDDAREGIYEPFTLDSFYEKIDRLRASTTANMMLLRKWVRNPDLLAKMSTDNPGYMLLMILRRSELKGMTEPQDRLYGIYGILQAVSSHFSASSLPRVDYTLPAYMVFGQFARFIIETTGSACLLDCALLSFRVLQGPTWVSMFHYMPKAYLKTTPKDPLQRPRVSADGSILTIKGVIKDQCVVLVRQPKYRQFELHDHVYVQEAINHIMEIESKVVQPVVSQQSLAPDDVRRALFPFISTSEAYEHYRLRGNEPFPYDLLITAESAAWGLTEVKSTIFVTRQGHFGRCQRLGPCDVGDYICLRTHGAPLILRNRPGSELYEVIGHVDACQETLKDRSGREFEDVHLV
ncbi:heterokaryon incompatibility protein [Colletotrichum kahawae]|uniref:Heterokaryon incompatibility protein n=1 Tax=Colletotrichum kahawae TaxID=34407 RepID=A0AAE0D6G9_COLKA|nr:heterokaryon incompatibility protein [Colletotrichum kahawae]